MKLRELRYYQGLAFPPIWIGPGVCPPSGEGGRLTGVTGPVARGRGIVLSMECQGAQYSGLLLVDPSQVRSEPLYRLLVANVGREIADIGDLEVPALTGAAASPESPARRSV
jgi:hypothetical protein